MTLNTNTTSRTKYPAVLAGLAGLAGAALLLTSCSAGAEPGTTTSPEASESAAASPTPTPTPTPTPASPEGPARNIPVPELPEAATKETKAGLLAFVDYWHQTISYAYETGDTKPVAEISMKSCGTCQNVMETIEKSHRGDSWMVGGKINVLRTETDFVPNSDDFYQVILELEQEKLSIYTQEGLQKETAADDERIYNLFVAEYLDGRWRLVDTGPPGNSGK